MPSTASLRPAHQITLDQTGRWLAMGWNDFLCTPALSMLFGGLFAGLGLVLFGLLHLMALEPLILVLGCGFMLVGPLAATCLYEVARRLEQGQPVTAPLVLGVLRHKANAIGDMGLVLAMILLVWLMAGLDLFALYYAGSSPNLSNFVLDMLFSPAALPYVLMGTAIGAVLAALAFSVSMFAMPMLIDQDVDAMPAIMFSLRAVWINRWNMIGWAATVASLTLMGMALGFVGLIVIFPVVAYASWHAYGDVTR